MSHCYKDLWKPLGSIGNQSYPYAGSIKWDQSVITGQISNLFSHDIDSFGSVALKRWYEFNIMPQRWGVKDFDKRAIKTDYWNMEDFISKTWQAFI